MKNVNRFAKIAGLCPPNGGFAPHKALILPKNVLYIWKMDRNDVATSTLPIREPYFSVAGFPGSQIRGRAIHA
jgi:hypothetical protein